MLDAPDPMGDFPFAFFVGSSMALGFFFVFVVEIFFSTT